MESDNLIIQIQKLKLYIEHIKNLLSLFEHEINDEIKLKDKKAIFVVESTNLEENKKKENLNENLEENINKFQIVINQFKKKYPLLFRKLLNKLNSNSDSTSC